MRLRSAAVFALLAAALSTACEDADDIVAPLGAGSGPGAGATLQIVSGDGQTGAVDQPLSELLVVEVVDANGDPVEGVAIAWTPGAGSSFGSAEGTTGADGRASASWRMGTAAGAYTADVSAEAGEVSFGAQALPGAADRIEIVSGDEQTGPVGAPLGGSLVVRVLDAFDNPVPNAALTWTPSGNSSFDSSQTDTDPEGRATATWRLGTQAGAYSAEVTAAPGSVTFDATATSGAAATLQIVSGDGQTAEVATELPAPLVVRVVDQYDNPVSGVALTWTPSTGSLLTADDLTGADGQASATWQLGTAAGPQDADVDASAGSVTFGAIATAGAAVTFEIVSGDEQAGTVAEILPLPLVVRAVDQYDNPVPGLAVSWTPSGGSSVVGAELATGGDGLASAGWQLGTSAGAYLTGVSAAPGSVTFDATANAGAPDHMVIVSGDNQLSVAGSDMTDSLVVQVLDLYDNPVGGAAVDWNMSHSGSASPTSMMTDATGMASTAWTLGCPALIQTATASNASAGSVDFHGTAVPGPPALIVNLTGDLEGVLGLLLFADLDVRVEDACGNPVAGVEVEWTLTSALGGLVSPPTSITDVNGEATTTLTLGILLGDYTVLAVAGALNTLFTVTLLP